VAQDAHGLCQRPLGGGVGGEAAVIDGERSLERRVQKVLVELADYDRPQHTLCACMPKLILGVPHKS